LKVVYPSTANFIAVIGRLGETRLTRRVKRAMQGATTLDVYSMNAPTWVPGIDFSDHRSYWAHGYPAVMVTDTAFYRNDRYHTSRDTPDTLDYRRMAEVVRGVHRAVLQLASLSRAGEWRADEPADQVALEDVIQHDRRDRVHRRHGHEQIPGRIVRRQEVAHRDGKGNARLAREQQQRIEILVPRIEERIGPDGDERRADGRQG